MKKIEWSKVFKALGIIAIIALVIIYFESRSSRIYKEREKVWLGIVSAAEDLHDLSIYADESKDYGYEDMQTSLYHLQEKCSEISERLEDLSHYFDEPEYEENRRSWFY